MDGREIATEQRKAMEKNMLNTTNMKLHVGCGILYRNGWVNIDPDPKVKADHHCSALNLPFADNVFDEIYSHHALEHISSDLFAIVDELARVSKDGCLWQHTTPIHTWGQHLQNPHHLYKWWGEHTFRFFDKENGIYKRGQQQNYSLQEISVEFNEMEISYKLKVKKDV